jgi:ABC-type multidrug transport system fused ATPase/permease subunit
VQSSLLILGKQDRQKSAVVVLIYLIMGIMDVAAVFILGLVGSLSVSGVSTGRPGDRVKSILEILGIGNLSLQNQVAVLGGMSAAALVFKSFMSLYLSRKTLLFLSRRAALISQTLVFRVLGQQMLKVREKTIQEMIFALTSGVQSVALGIIGSAMLLIADIFLILAFSISLFVVDTLVAVMSLMLFSTVGVFLYRIMHNKASDLGEEATRLNIVSNDKIAEVVSCYRELLVKNRRSFYAEKIGGLRFEIAEASAKVGFMGLLSKYVMEITLVVGGLLIGVAQFVTQPASRAVAVLAIFLVSSARIGPAVLRVQTGLVMMRTNIGSAKPTLDLVKEYLDSDDFAVEKATEFRGRWQFDHFDFTPEIEIEEISFAYPGGNDQALKRFSANINSGEFVGVVGPSGAGKTTLADVMLGLIEPDKGQILISGVSPIEAFKKWPGAVAYVPQEVSIVNGTIKDNVCLGFDAAKVSDAEVSEILNLVQLSEYANADGLRAPAGERGNKLSGGQRQRLGLARALFTNPKLLILDEATSALDSTTEKKITDYLDSVKGTLTLIVIAHRLSTLQSADKVLYVQGGRLLAQGTFDQLREVLPQFDLQARQMGFN